MNYNLHKIKIFISSLIYFFVTGLIGMQQELPKVIIVNKTENTITCNLSVKINNIWQTNDKLKSGDISKNKDFSFDFKTEKAKDSLYKATFIVNKNELLNQEFDFKMTTIAFNTIVITLKENFQADINKFKTNTEAQKFIEQSKNAIKPSKEKDDNESKIYILNLIEDIKISDKENAVKKYINDYTNNTNTQLDKIKKDIAKFEAKLRNKQTPSQKEISQNMSNAFKLKDLSDKYNYLKSKAENKEFKGKFDGKKFYDALLNEANQKINQTIKLNFYCSNENPQSLDKYKEAFIGFKETSQIELEKSSPYLMSFKHGETSTIFKNKSLNKDFYLIIIFEISEEGILFIPCENENEINSLKNNAIIQITDAKNFYSSIKKIDNSLLSKIALKTDTIKKEQEAELKIEDQNKLIKAIESTLGEFKDTTEKLNLKKNSDTDSINSKIQEAKNKIRNEKKGDFDKISENIKITKISPVIKQLFADTINKITSLAEELAPPSMEDLDLSEGTGVESKSEKTEDMSPEKKKEKLSQINEKITNFNIFQDFLKDELKKLEDQKKDLNKK